MLSSWPGSRRVGAGEAGGGKGCRIFVFVRRGGIPWKGDGNCELATIRTTALAIPCRVARMELPTWPIFDQGHPILGTASEEPASTLIAVATVAASTAIRGTGIAGA